MGFSVGSSLLPIWNVPPRSETISGCRNGGDCTGVTAATVPVVAGAGVGDDELAGAGGAADGWAEGVSEREGVGGAGAGSGCGAAWGDAGSGSAAAGGRGDRTASGGRGAGDAGGARTGEPASGDGGAGRRGAPAVSGGRGAPEGGRAGSLAGTRAGTCSATCVGLANRKYQTAPATMPRKITSIAMDQRVL